VQLAVGVKGGAALCVRLLAVDDRDRGIGSAHRIGQHVSRLDGTLLPIFIGRRDSLSGEAVYCDVNLLHCEVAWVFIGGMVYLIEGEDIDVACWRTRSDEHSTERWAWRQ